MFSLRRLFRRERRVYPRFNIRCDVMFGQKEPFTISTAVDLSFSGIAVRSSQKAPPGTKIEVRIMPSGPQSEDWIEIEGLIRRAEGQVLGIEFLGLSGSQRAALARLLPPDAAKALMPDQVPLPSTSA